MNLKFPPAATALFVSCLPVCSDKLLVGAAGILLPRMDSAEHSDKIILNHTLPGTTLVSMCLSDSTCSR